MKTAILQVADTGPLESLVAMLGTADYRCLLPSSSLKSALRRAGCDTVLDVEQLVRGWGYDAPFPLQEASLQDMESCDLFVDVKGHRNGPLIEKRWPNLRGKILWYRINGGQPEHVIRRDDTGQVIEDCGDEVNPPCPVLTPNQWYLRSRTDLKDHLMEMGNDLDEFTEAQLEERFTEWSGRVYSCWPPFVRFGDYFDRWGRAEVYDDPICLIHKVHGWGYGNLVSPLREGLGVRVLGLGSPDGLVSHHYVPKLLSRAKAYVHLKSNDAPGYALYEAMAAGCPIILPRRLIWRCRMQDMFQPFVNCLAFDRETHESLSPADVERCAEEIRGHLLALENPVYNRQIGMAGRDRLRHLMWSTSRETDVTSLREFLARNFPG